MGEFIIIVSILVFVVMAIKSVDKMLRDDNARKARETEQQRDRELLEEAYRLATLVEVARQAQAVGDNATYDAVMSNTYSGKLPERRSDGLYLSMYDNLRILRISGMKYRGNLSAYVGAFKGVLVPEPKNEYDSHAIMVKCEDGKHLGYVREDQTDLVRWLVGVPQPLGGEPTLFPPYRITGDVTKEEDAEGKPFFTGCIYIKKKE